MLFFTSLNDANSRAVFQGFLYKSGQRELRAFDEAALFDCVLESDDVPPGQTGQAPLSATEAFLWIDATAPTPDEIAALAKRFKLDPQVLEDLSSNEERPKLHDYEHYLYVVWHQVALQMDATAHLGDEHRPEIELLEIDCLLGADWILTLHPRPIETFDLIKTRWKRRPDWMRDGPGQLLYELMDGVLDTYFPILERLDGRIDVFEDRLYNNSTRDGGSNSGSLSSEIFALRRVLLQIRHVAAPTGEVVSTLMRRDSEVGGKHFAAFQDLHDHAARILSNIDTYRDILSGALDANLAIESNRMNAVMKRLTSYSIILLLPSLIAGIFGMNFGDMPIERGFFAALIAMGAVLFALLMFFKRKGWL